jgi:hypothetical protein
MWRFQKALNQLRMRQNQYRPESPTWPATELRLQFISFLIAAMRATNSICAHFSGPSDGRPLEGGKFHLRVDQAQKSSRPRWWRSNRQQLGLEDRMNNAMLWKQAALSAQPAP